MLVLLIGYIKPLYIEFTAKQVVYGLSEQQLKQVNDRLANINTVSADFSSDFTETFGGKSKQEALMDQYIPESMDQDRIVDAFNYLAGQSGILISSMSMEKPAANAAAEAAITTSADILLNSAGTTGGANAIPSDGAIALKASYPAPKTYHAKLSVSGNYEAFVAFFNRIYRMNRENEIESFSLTKSVSTDKTEGDEQEGSVLTGDISVVFMYYPGLTSSSIQNAEALSAFSSGKIDDKASSYIESKTQSDALPALVVGEFSTRTNPFVK